MFEVAATESPEEFLACVREQLVKLPSQLWRSGNASLGAVAAGLDAIEVQVGSARVALVEEAEVRGAVDESPATSPADWLLRHSVHLEPADATRAVDLSHHLRQPRNQLLAGAVAEGAVTVRKAMTVLRHLHQVEHRLDPLKREEALGSLTQMARTGYDRHVRCAGRYLMSVAGADGALERDEDALRGLSGLRFSMQDNGMLRISGQLDPESAAVLQATLDPLSAPRPCEADGGRDTRPAERRRAEALVEVCRRATASGGEAPATVKSQVVVTIDLESLQNRVRGAGLTPVLDVLSPETVRKMACDASITPMVLGGDGQPLDVGRSRRLVTPAILAALRARDRGCTFAGCGRPPGWCDAHHLRHWADGGPTSLDNLALLCARHHTYVHQHRLTADVTASGVTWCT